MEKRGKFFIVQTTNGYYSFQFIAPNGEVVFKSEAYVSPEAAENAVAMTGQFGVEEKNYERKSSSGGRYYFIIKNNVGAVLATSELYHSVASRDSAVELVKKLLANTKVETQKGYIPGLIEFVKAERKKARLSQEELAIKAGVGKRFVQDLEGGKQSLRLDKVNQVLRLFGHEMKPQPFDKNDNR